MFQYFESQTLHQERLLKTGEIDPRLLNVVHFNFLKNNINTLFIEINCFHSVPVLSELPPVKGNIEELEASLNQSQEQTKEQVKGFISKIRQIIQDKVTNIQEWFFT